MGKEERITMITCPIDGFMKKHLSSLLDWVIEEISFSGGDGDATIVLKRHSLKDFRRLVIEWLKNNAVNDWEVSEIQNDRYFTAGRFQEGLVVTIDRNDVPEWSQCTIEL